MWKVIVDYGDGVEIKIPLLAHHLTTNDMLEQRPKPRKVSQERCLTLWISFEPVFYLFGLKRLTAEGRGHHGRPHGYPYFDKFQTYCFMTAVACRCKFSKGAVEFLAILSFDRVAKLLRRLQNSASVCFEIIWKEGSRILQSRPHLQQLIFGQRPVSEVTRQPQL